MKKLFLFALVATMFAACVTDETQDVAVELAPETLTVSFEETDSRIQLNEAGKTVWTKGDEVSVFYLSNANQKWQYQGETGERTGNLMRVENATATHELTKVVVVYPYNSNYYINPESYNIKAQLPATQTYLANSYGVGGNIMISQGEYNQFSLKSACGWLKLQLTGNGEKVKSIKLKGNNGEQVAGEIYINSATAVATLASEMGGADDSENSAGGNLVFDDTILTEVTLDCGEGVTLGAEPTAFYIALPPQTFAQGLTIVIEDSDALKMTKSTDKEVVISRNAIQPMAAFGFEGVQPNNVILYTASTKVEPDSESQFGANIVSNIYENGKGVITFDGDVTSIGDYAFWNCRSLTSVTIPDSVTSIGDWAFDGCSSLTSITIGNSVTSFGHSAFNGCSSLKAFYGKFASADNRCLIVDGTLKLFAPAGLTEYTIPDSVTSIGNQAFSGCTSLKSITIPDSITEIKGYAFHGCLNLSSVTIGNGVKSIGNDAFFDCLNLTNLDLGNSITSIGSYAFGGCGYLTDITIPESVTEIGEAIFNCCHKLTNIYFKPTTPPSGCYNMFYLRSGGANGVTIYVPYASVDAYKTAECLNPYADKIVAYDFEKGEIVDTTPETWKIRYTATAQVTPYITEVFGANIVSNKWDETTGEGVITFDGEVTSIGKNAFSQCSRLTGIIIPDSVTEIGEYAFYYSGLTNITIPTNVETIGDMAFGDCPIKEFKGKFAEDNGRCLVINGELRFGVLKGITEYTIPEGVTKIGHRAFVRSSLESIIIANDVKKIGPDSFYYCSNLKTVVIGDGVTEMSSTVFDHCENLTNVTLGNSLTNIGFCAFYYCKSLQSITIPDSVTKIDTNAFYGCSSLTTITIPQNVSTILSGAFQYCPNLKTVYCQATTPPYTDSYSNYASYWPTFNDNAEGRVIYVPRNSVNAYKAAGGWKNYSNDIVGYSF